MPSGLMDELYINILMTKHFLVNIQQSIKSHYYYFIEKRRDTTH